jgi:hypothetical protein
MIVYDTDEMMHEREILMMVDRWEAESDEPIP